MAAAMTDHIQNNPFGRSTDGHRDDWSAVQIDASLCQVVRVVFFLACELALSAGQLGVVGW
jgi:hypothetical protein